MHRKRINLSHVFTGQRVDIEEVDDGLWNGASAMRPELNGGHEKRAKAAGLGDVKVHWQVPTLRVSDGYSILYLSPMVMHREQLIGRSTAAT